MAIIDQICCSLGIRYCICYWNDRDPLKWTITHLGKDIQPYPSASFTHSVQKRLESTKVTKNPPWMGFPTLPSFFHTFVTEMIGTDRSEQKPPTLDGISSVVFGFFPGKDHVGLVILLDFRCSGLRWSIERIFDDDSVGRTRNRITHAVHVLRRDPKEIKRFVLICKFSVVLHIFRGGRWGQGDLNRSQNCSSSYDGKFLKEKSSVSAYFLHHY